MNEIRVKVRQKCEKLNGLYEQSDLKRVLTEDSYVLKYIEECDDDNETAVARIIQVLKWRKQFRVKDINSESFSEQFLDLIETSVFVRKESGIEVVYIRFKLFKSSVLENDYKMFIVYMLELIERRSPNRRTPWRMIFDVADSDVFNLYKDIDLFEIDKLMTYFPQNISYTLVYQLPYFPWILFKLMYFLLPSKFYSEIDILNKDEVYAFLNLSNFK